jgi:uncharacterized protein (DUF58 family)
LLLGSLIYAIAILGLTTLNGGILALIIPFLVFLGLSLYYGPEDPQLKIRRTLSADRASHDTPVTVTLSVTNEGSRLELVHIFDAPPPQLEVRQGETEMVTSLDAGETIEFQYILSGKRGRYEFGSVRVQAADLLGLFQRQTLIEAPGLFEFFIYPKVLRLGRIPIRPRQTKVYAGYIPARVGGSGVEFFNVRTYQPGDALRHINWRANARHRDTFFTNEFQQERVADVGIILDARQRSNVQLENRSLFEHTVEAAAALADSFLNDGNRVALLRYGDFLDWTVPGYGKLQRERILQALDRAQTGDSMVFDQLQNLPTRLFPSKSQLVLVSPLTSDDVEPLTRLRARGYQLLVVSPDPIAFETSMLEKGKLIEMAARIAQVERELLFRKLRQAGIQIINWRVDIPLDEAMVSSVARLQSMARRNIGVLTS